MTAAIPATRANELFNEFTEVAQAEDALNEFTLAKFFRDAKAEVSRHPAPAYMLMGAVSAYKFDLECMHRYHKLAIDLEDSELIRRNYAVSLQLVSLVADAADQAVIASEKCPEDLECLLSAIKLTWSAGRIESTLQLIDLYKKRGGEDMELMSLAYSAKQVLEQRGLTDRIFQRSIEVSASVLRENKIRAVRSTITIDEDGTDSSILVSYLLNLAQSEVDSLQGILAEYMLDTLGDDWHPDALMFEFVPK